MTRPLPVLISSVLGSPNVGNVGIEKMPIETLAEFVSRVRNAKGLSLKAVEQQSARRGHKIAASYVFRIENALSRNPSKDLLIALARGLEEPEEVVFAIARGRMPPNKEDSRELQLLANFRELPDSYKDDVLKITRILN